MALVWASIVWAGITSLVKITQKMLCVFTLAFNTFLVLTFPSTFVFAFSFLTGVLALAFRVSVLEALGPTVFAVPSASFRLT